MWSGLVIAAISFGFLYAFVNGFHDGCNVVATVIASRSMSPKKALLVGVLGEFIGPLVFGSAVAVTVGTGIIRPSGLYPEQAAISVLLLLSALMGAVLWDVITWWAGLPTSSSHALVGGLVGAGVVAHGFGVVNWAGLIWKVALPLFLSPVVGLFIGYVAMVIVIALFQNFPPKIGKLFKGLQVLSTGFLAASHGTNDAQKAMGVITLVLMVIGRTEVFVVPGWVVVGCAAAIALGLSTGGWRIIRTVGTRIFRLKPVHSFTSQAASSAVIAGAALLGGPVSTTQVVSSTVMGVGAAQRASAVRWTVMGQIIQAWLFTMPASAGLSIGCFYILKYLFINR